MQIFKNKFGELRSGWAVLVIIVLIIIGQLTAGFLAPDEAVETEVWVKIAVTLLYGAITVIGGLFLFRVLYGQGSRQLGLIPEKWLTDFLHGAAMGAISMGLLFFVLLMSGQAELIEIDWSKLVSLAIIVELCSVSVFAFSEELLARGFMMTAMKATRNKYTIVVVPAALFSLIHFLNPGVTIFSFINTLLAGLLFAYLFIKSGKLWVPTSFHIMWNFFQGDIFGMNVSGGEEYAVFHTKMGTNQLLTGGEYGPEGGIFVTVVLLLGFVYAYFAIKPSSSPSWTISSDLPLAKKHR